LVDGGFGETSVEFDDDEHWLQFTRGTVRVVCNFGDEALGTPLKGSVLLATDDEAALEDGTLSLPGASAAVVRVQ
jgi:maltooligosyltrehalose trehalohydrolase